MYPDRLKIPKIHIKRTSIIKSSRKMMRLGGVAILAATSTSAQAAESKYAHQSRALSALKLNNVECSERRGLLVSLNLMRSSDAPLGWGASNFVLKADEAVLETGTFSAAKQGNMDFRSACLLPETTYELSISDNKNAFEIGAMVCGSNYVRPGESFSFAVHNGKCVKSAAAAAAAATATTSSTTKKHKKNLRNNGGTNAYMPIIVATSMTYPSGYYVSGAYYYYGPPSTGSMAYSGSSGGGGNYYYYDDHTNSGSMKYSAQSAPVGYYYYDDHHNTGSMKYSGAKTHAPTPVPTNTVFATPTFFPSMPPVLPPISISLDVSQSIDGLKSSVMDTSAADAFLDTAYLAVCCGKDFLLNCTEPADVTNCIGAPGLARESFKMVAITDADDRRLSGRALAAATGVSLSYSIVDGSVTGTQTDLMTKIESSINSAVNQGTFATSLSALDVAVYVPGTFKVKTASVSAHVASPTAKPTSGAGTNSDSNASTAMSAGNVAGAVLGTLAAVALIGAMVYYVRLQQLKSSSSPGLLANDSAAKNAYSEDPSSAGGNVWTPGNSNVELRGSTTDSKSLTQADVQQSEIAPPAHIAADFSGISNPIFARGGGNVVDVIPRESEVDRNSQRRL